MGELSIFDRCVPLKTVVVVGINHFELVLFKDDASIAVTGGLMTTKDEVNKSWVIESGGLEDPKPDYGDTGEEIK